MMDITRKQYLISATPKNLPEMNEIRLSCGAYLYVGTGLVIKDCTDAVGRKYIVLGNVFCADRVGKTVEDDINAFSGDDVNELIKDWTGRWVLIAENEIQIDACGLMSAFYTQGSDWCISSSLAVISSVIRRQPSYTVSDFGLNWQLLPDTLIDGVSALLCTQKFVVNDAQLSVCFNPYITDYSHLKTQEKVSRIAEILKNTLTNIAHYSGRDIWIALTAGRDSRLLIAAALAAGVKFSTYTAQHDNISTSDRKIPAKLARQFGFIHRYIKSSKVSSERINDYLIFSAGNSKGADLEFYARGQFDMIPSNAIVLRGAIFEAARTYGRSIASADMNGFKKGVQSYYQTSLSNPKQSDAFEKWLEYVETNPISYIDLRDRMYVEQRVGGWVAAIEQALDINDWASVQIANCRDLVSLLLSATEQERESVALSMGCIEILYPQLNNYPYNQSSVYDKIRLIKNVLISPARLKRFFKKIFR